MAKLVWLEKNQVQERLIPDNGFLSLGRGLDNAVILDDPQVSRHHARLVAGPRGWLLKDLESDYGIQVNGDPVESCFLKDGDLIRIGQQVLEFVAESRADSPQRVPEPTPPGLDPMVEAKQKARASWYNPSGWRRAFLRFVDGPNKGRILTVDRPLVPVGEPDGYYAAISCRSNGLYLLNLGKRRYAVLNGEPVQGGGVALRDGDSIRVGEHLIELKIFEQTVQ